MDCQRHPETACQAYCRNSYRQRDRQPGHTVRVVLAYIKDLQLMPREQHWLICVEGRVGPQLSPLNDHRSGVSCVQFRPRARCVFRLLVRSESRGIDMCVAIRYMLVSQNKKLDKSGVEDLTDAERDRIEEAARLEGLTLEEALERKKGFRYLY